MKSDIVLRIEKALKEYTPSKIDGVRIATAQGRLYKSLRKLYAVAYNLRCN